MRNFFPIGDFYECGIGKIHREVGVFGCHLTYVGQIFLVDRFDSDRTVADPFQEIKLCPHAKVEQVGDLSHYCNARVERAHIIAQEVLDGFVKRVVPIKKGD